ncbi:LisH and RanBPM domains containing protein [Zea mays]|uniref:LisH and RanBPM domains containing protein n=1 Tax=Zea mays TaxID=4577 RepID=A0A1D6PFB9_MAIZE|nr:LisH and RanBPM domains containing protein [Zea mays]
MFLSRIVLRDLDSIDSPASMASSKKVVTRDEWELKLRDVKIRKEDMNRLVMNFLVTEGFVDAADKFRIESGTQPEIDLATITDRMEVKRAVQSGNVQEAIEKINDLNPTILDTNPQLYFHLQQQKLIELIRVGKINEALEFAQEELAPRGEENVFIFLDSPLHFILVSGFRCNLFDMQLNRFKDTCFFCLFFFAANISRGNRKNCSTTGF